MTQNSDYDAAILAEPGILYAWACNEGSSATSLAAAFGGVDLAFGTTTGKPTPGAPSCISDGFAVSTDGNDLIHSASNLNLNYGTIGYEIICKIPPTGNSSKVISEFGSSVVAGPGFAISTNGTTNLQAICRTDVGINSAQYPLPQPANTKWMHLFAKFTIGNANEADLYINGVLQTPGSRPFTNNNTTNFSAADRLNIACRNFTTTAGATIVFTKVAIYNCTSGDPDIAGHAVLAGFPDPTVNTSTAFAAADLAFDVMDPLVDVPTQASKSALRLTTNARSFDFVGVTDEWSASGGPAQAKFGIEIDDVPTTVLAHTADGSKTFTVTLGHSTSAADPRKVVIFSGPQLMLSGSVKSTRFDFTDLAVTGGTATLLPLPTAPRDGQWADSLSTGIGASNPTLEGYDNLQRRLHNRNLCLVSWGSRAAQTDVCTGGSYDAVKAAAFVSRQTSYNFDTFTCAIGINDWGDVPAAIAKNNWADAVAQTLDLYHAQNPHVSVIWWTFLTVANEAAANGVGDTPESWRVAIRARAATREWINLKEPTGFLTAGDFADCVHMNTIGYPKVDTWREAEMVKATLYVAGTASNGTYDLGAVATNTDITHQFTIRNKGATDGTLGTLSTTGTGWSVSVSDNPSGQAILHGYYDKTVTVTGNFASPGAKTGTLVIPSDDPAGSYTINLAATVSSSIIPGSRSLLGVGA